MRIPVNSPYTALQGALRPPASSGSPGFGLSPHRPVHGGDERSQIASPSIANDVSLSGISAILPDDAASSFMEMSMPVSLRSPGFDRLVNQFQSEVERNTVRNNSRRRRRWAQQGGGSERSAHPSVFQVCSYVIA